MKSIENYAFIDGNNLYLGAKAQGIKVDYRKLRLYLKHKFNVAEAFIFIGHDSTREKLYLTLRQAGFQLIQKPTIKFYKNGKKTMKGNVDAELVLHSAAIEYTHYDKAVVVTSDGDFRCLFEYLRENNKLERIITPTKFYSSLFQPLSEFILPLETISEMIEFDH